jgi:hypothetical protein
VFVHGTTTFIRTFPTSSRRAQVCVRCLWFRQYVVHVLSSTLVDVRNMKTMNEEVTANQCRDRSGADLESTCKAAHEPFSCSANRLVLVRRIHSHQNCIRITCSKLLYFPIFQTRTGTIHGLAFDFRTALSNEYHCEVSPSLSLLPRSSTSLTFSPLSL